MTEPRIQYAKTSDGVSIAFWSIGEGLPVIAVPPIPWTHLLLEWHDPDYRAWDERLARGKRLTRYDSRGSGLSDRKVTDFSLEALMLDVDAVADRLGLERFALAGISVGGPVAIAYAARRPERVSHLVLWCAYSRWEDIDSQQGHALRALRQTDWQLFTETTAHALVAGWSAGEPARRFAQLMRESVSPEAAREGDRTLRAIDVTGELSRIACPTLVLHRRGARFPTPEAAMQIAAGIPGAELVLLDGEALLPFVGDMEPAAAAVDRFLGLPVQEETAAPAPAPGGLVTVLFTDIEGSTTLTQRVGDARAQEALRLHNTIVRDALKAHGGSEIKHTGDGIMAAFPSASGAIECAIGIQRAIEGGAGTGPAKDGVRVRIGLNAGEPVAEERDLFGTAVQLARRICDSAEPGHILASLVVRELAAGKGFLFADRGEVVLRGFDDPVRVYEVKWTP